MNKKLMDLAAQLRLRHELNNLSEAGRERIRDIIKNPRKLEELTGGGSNE